MISEPDFLPRLLPSRRDENIPISDVSVFAALQVDRSRQFLVAVKSATSDTRNFLIINNRLAILDHCDHSSNQRNIETLPVSWLARQFGRRSQETVHSAGMMTGRFLDGVGFNLHLVAAAQIHATIGVRRTVELDMQLEIFELGIVDKLCAVSRAYQRSVFDSARARGIWIVHPPPREIFSIEQRDSLPPLRCACSAQRRCPLAGPLPRSSIWPGCCSREGTPH